MKRYPSRTENEGKFIPRSELVGYWQPINLSPLQYQKYLHEGFLILRNFFPEVKAAQLEASCLFASPDYGHVTMEPGAPFIRAITGVHEAEAFQSIAHDPTLVEIVSSILGSRIYFHQSRINYKAGLGANGWSWHSDFETWHVQDGMPAMRCLTAMIPLTENTIYNGSLMVLPGSHEHFYACKKMPTVSAEENFADQKEGVPDNASIERFFELSGGRIEMITCSPGDLVLFDCNTIHVSTPNMTPLSRTNLFFVYNSVENMLDPVSVPRPEEMGSREKITIL